MNRTEILESLQDLILSLQDEKKVNSPRFRDEWLKKKVLTETAIDSLNKDDFDWLNSEYLKWAIK
jgi:hypothetical protein